MLETDWVKNGVSEKMLGLKIEKSESRGEKPNQQVVRR